MNVKSLEGAVNPCNNCLKCDKPNSKCLACNTSTFYFIQNLVCAKSTKTNCLKINQVGFCTLCSPNYFVKIGSCAAVVPINSCDVYNTASFSTVCIKCLDGNILVSNKCLKIIPNCFEYDPSDGSCFQCQNTMMINPGKTSCIPGTSDNCQVYYLNRCNGCNDGYGLTPDFKCYLKPKFCQVEDGTSGGCLLCQDSYFSFPNVGTCVKQIKGCKVFGVLAPNTNMVSCSICEDNYYLLAEGTCLAKYENCLAIDLVNGVCVLCSANAIMSSDSKICFLKLPNCVFYLNSKFTDKVLMCRSCANGYQLTNDNSLCLKSIFDCDIYQLSDFSTTSFVCIRCKFGLATISNGSACQDRSIANCLTLDPKSLKCLQCQTNFELVLLDTNCFASIPFCTLSTVVNNALVCQTCVSGRILTSNKICVILIQNCATYIPENGLCLTCLSGFTLSIDGTVCSSTINNCIKFSTSTSVPPVTLCTACKIGYSLYQNNCYYIIPNCSTFKNGQCAVCDSGYLLSNDASVCLPKVNLCSVYQASSLGTSQLKCLICLNNLSPTTDKFACLPKIQFCQEYQPSDLSMISLTCKTCNIGYTLIGNVCSPNASLNCLVFNRDTQLCTTCSIGYSLTSDFLLCLPFIAFCVTYQTSTSQQSALICSECSGGFLLTDDSMGCFLIIRNCIKYAPSKGVDGFLKCSQCQSGYFLSPDSKVCSFRTISSCAKMDTVLAICVECTSGHHLSDDGLICFDNLVSCTSYQPSLSQNQNLVCTNCAPDYTLLGGICFGVIIQNCQTYQNSLCSACINGFFVTSDNKRCLFSIFQCSAYNSSTVLNSSLTCSKCNDGYFLIGNFCAQTVPNCLQYDQILGTCLACATLFTKTTDGSNCLDSIPGCLTYAISNFSTGQLLCLQCIPSQIPESVGYSCVDKIIDECKTFDKVTGTCLVCNPDFRLTDDSQLCLSAIPNCKIYQPSNSFNQIFVCGQCFSGYNLFINTCRLKVFFGCAVRDPNTGLCTKCSGTSLPTDDGLACLASIDNCINYSPNTSASTSFYCKTCKKGFISLSSNTICAEIIPYCDIYNDSYGFCLTCQNNYQVSLDFEVCFPKIFNCDTYAPSYIGDLFLTCQFCANNYTLLNNNTLCDLSSNSNNGSTPVCSDGWSLTDDNNKCLPLIAYCTVYSPTSKVSLFNVCLQCDSTSILSLTGDECIKLSTTS